MKIAIIGGPFYWKLWGIEPEKIQVETPYGKPADFLFKGVVGQHKVITLLRHGAQNEFSLSEMPFSGGAASTAKTSLATRCPRRGYPTRSISSLRSTEKTASGFWQSSMALSSLRRPPLPKRSPRLQRKSICHPRI